MLLETYHDVVNVLLILDLVKIHVINFTLMLVEKLLAICFAYMRHDFNAPFRAFLYMQLW